MTQREQRLEKSVRELFDKMAPIDAYPEETHKPIKEIIKILNEPSEPPAASTFITS